MKYQTTVVSFASLLLTLTTSTTALPAKSSSSDPLNFAHCQLASPSIISTIDKFCSKPDIMVPSTYASTGMLSSSGYRVKITGNCAPGEWVPSLWCGVQLRQICADKVYSTLPKQGNMVVAKEGGTLNWGSGGCQAFTVEYDPYS